MGGTKGGLGGGLGDPTAGRFAIESRLKTILPRTRASLWRFGSLLLASVLSCHTRPVRGLTPQANWIGPMAVVTGWTLWLERTIRNRSSSGRWPVMLGWARSMTSVLGSGPVGEAGTGRKWTPRRGPELFPDVSGATSTSRLASKHRNCGFLAGRR